MGRDESGTDAVTRVGVVSDTHGHLPHEVMDAFEGVDAILHAGDVEDNVTLDLLGAIAPVTAVRGNCDEWGETSALPDVANVRLGGLRFLVGHKKKALLARFDPAKTRARVVVTGHSHKAHVEVRDGVLFLNPGSASDPRDGDPASVAVIEIEGDDVRVRIVEL